jgi:ribosomal protein S6--L-glutamate ligase
VKLTPEERSTALRATKAMGLRIAGVDMMRSHHGPVVLEVNSSPGLEGIENATKVDVAAKIIDYMASHANDGRKEDRLPH